MRVLIISPHCDDAVWSIGEHMLTWIRDGHQLTVLTVYGAMPTDTAGKLKHTLLNAEHAAVMKLMGVASIRLDFLDDVYEPRPSGAEIFNALAPYPEQFDLSVWPAGIHHPDHRVVADMAAGFTTARWRYDELPYFVLWPEEATDPDSPVDAWLPAGSRDYLEEKRVLCRMYVSQVGPLVERCLYVPERVWAPVP